MPPDPVTALATLGMEATPVCLLEDQRNTTWKIETPSGAPLILRRYRTDRGMEVVAYELEVVEGLDRLGWPVPVAVAPPRVIDGAVWCVCRFLNGAPLERTANNQRLLGRLIAKLQADLATLGITHQRKGWRRVDEIFDESFDRTLDVWAARLPAEIDVVREFAGRARRQLLELESSGEPSVLVHGDLTTWNVHYSGTELTGLFDLEMVHRDILVAEFAHTWRGRYEGFIEGFEEITPLTDRQRMLIAPARWAWLVGFAAHALEHTRDEQMPDLSWTMEQLARRSPLMRF